MPFVRTDTGSYCAGDLAHRKEEKEMIDGAFIPKERVEELAEQEIVRYVQNVMETFQQSGYAHSDSFDPRMQSIVERTIREIIYRKYQTAIDDAVRKISPKKYIELIIDQLRYMGVIKCEEDD
jgi:hypothetical protein